MDIKSELGEYLYGEHSDYYEDYIPVSINKMDNYYNYKYMADSNAMMREVVLNKANELQSFDEQISFFKRFFSESFLYDYHLIFNNRKIIFRKFEIGGEKFSCQPSIAPTRDFLSDNLYLTKLAQCSTYAFEMQYMLDKLGYKNKVVQEQVECYNAFTGKGEVVDHFYNVVERNGEETVIDISREIMQRDKQIIEEKSENQVAEENIHEKV